MVHGDKIKAESYLIYAVHILVINSVRPSVGLSSRRLTRHQNGKEKPTNVTCVELVNTDQNADSCGPKRPGRQGAKDRELALMEIVDDDGVELHTE